MKKTIELSVIADAIEETMGGWQGYYNMVTGEMKSLPDWSNAYADPEEYREDAEEIEESEDYIGNATAEQGPGKLSLLKAVDPALQTADGFFRDVFLVLGCGCQYIDLAEPVVRRVQWIFDQEPCFRLRSDRCG